MNDEEWLQKLSNFSDKLEDLQDRIRELEITLHGKRSKTGMLAEYARHDELLARMYAVIWQDPTGQKGILHDIDVLMGRVTAKAQSTQYKWQFWGLILATIISSATALLVSWDKILKLLPKDHPGILEQKIERGRHPKSPKKIYRYRIVPAAPTEPGPPAKMPENQDPDPK